MSKMASSLASPLAVRFNHETMELLRLATMAPGNKYSSFADFVREAVEEKIAREDLRLKYEPLLLALEEMKRRDSTDNN